MKTKVLEIRDAGTFIPALAIDMNPEPHIGAAPTAEMYLLRRCGYACDCGPNVLLTRLDGNGQATNDPYGWKGDTRTFPVAHNWIIEHWSELKDGDVVDVQFILGETPVPKVSERLSSSEISG